jgi:hypothetical protein
VSFNQLFADEPQPEIAGSAVLGAVHVGAGAILALGLVVRSHGAAVSIGNHSDVGLGPAPDAVATLRRV